MARHYDFYRELEYCLDRNKSREDNLKSLNAQYKRVRKQFSDDAKLEQARLVKAIKVFSNETEYLKFEQEVRAAEQHDKSQHGKKVEQTPRKSSGITTKLVAVVSFACLLLFLPFSQIISSLTKIIQVHQLTDLDLSSPEGILAKQGPEKVYELLTKTPEETFKDLTDKNRDRHVSLSNIDIPAAKTTVEITAIHADQLPRMAYLKDMSHTNPGHCYLITVTPTSQIWVYDWSRPINNLGFFEVVLCFDNNKPYVLRGSRHNVEPLSDKANFIDDYSEYLESQLKNISSKQKQKQQLGKPPPPLRLENSTQNQPRSQTRMPSHSVPEQAERQDKTQNVLSVLERELISDLKANGGSELFFKKNCGHYLSFFQEHADPLAQYFLGTCYLKGLAVPQSITEAVNLTRKSADQGNAHAQVNLGWFYENGEGLPKNNEEAVLWYRRAAEQGDGLGQTNLGKSYLDGSIGLLKSYVEAFNWLSKAAKQGYTDAQVSLGVMYEKGEGIDQNNSEAADLYERAAEQGNLLGIFNLGRSFEKGIGRPQSFDKAISWYRKAANRGDYDSQVGLAKLLRMQLIEGYKTPNG